MGDREHNYVARARLTNQMREALDQACTISGQNHSQVIRDCLVEGLTNRGVWPPVEGVISQHEREMRNRAKARRSAWLYGRTDR